MDEEIKQLPEVPDVTIRQDDLLDSARTSSAGSRGQPPPHNAADLAANLLKEPTIKVNPPSSNEDTESVVLEGDDEEPPEPRSFERSNSPSVFQRNKGAAYAKVGDDGINGMHRFSLYETGTRFYLVGGDVMDKNFRVLKIDRTAPPGNLSIFEDDIVYDKREMNQLLNAIDDGNKPTGGLKLKCSTWGLLGFIRFTEAYYMLLITKRTQVAMLGGHYIYQVDGTDLVPLTTGSSSRFQRDRNAEEARFLGILNNLDLNHYFYFSYSYDITRTLQHNIVSGREALRQGIRRPLHNFNEMFVWNHYLLEPAVSNLKNTYDWCLPIIHGFIDQSSLDIFGRRVYITIIARRSRFFAGARFLKRGANDLGYVANDVETEQIVSDIVTTSFHAPGSRLYASPTHTSYVQHRGSIPLYWTQDNTGVNPKPDIELNLIDPFYSAAAMHFDNLFERYGAPVYVLNLIKARERTPRESKLLHEYRRALDYLNQSLPADKKILYKAFDMSRASKTRGGDVIGTLEIIAEEVMQKTGFFHNGDSEHDTPCMQNGVARTNCIDCLDRTNAAQFVVGKRALGYQLHALGVISESYVDYDTDAVNIFTNMFHDHGDSIAVQYGGSHLVNTMATYRKLNHWQSQSRDMVESFKRYYHNSFHDSQRQEAYNLFLGNYIFAQGQPMLWDLSTDYYLHHTDPRKWLHNTRKNYINWYTPGYLNPRTLPEVENPDVLLQANGITFFDDYWLEYYRPLAISSFLKIFSYKTNTSKRYVPERTTHGGVHEISPFRPRRPSEPESPGKKAPRKGVTILDPHSESDSQRRKLRIAQPEENQARQSILRDRPNDSRSAATTPSSSTFVPADKTLMTQWSLNQFHDNSLNPSVTDAEAEEYQRYINHPLNLPLVVSTEEQEAEPNANLDYAEYVSSVGGEAGDLHHERQWEVNEEEIAEYMDFLAVSENPLTVTDEDGAKKRYNAYRKWLLKGKSLFKQSKVDPEYTPISPIRPLL